MARTPKEKPKAPEWSHLLHEAVSKKGALLGAYRAFHNYSLGNQFIAWMECQKRGIKPGPIATYTGWKSKGRQVDRGQKAISLLMPITYKKKVKDSDGNETEEPRQSFIFRPNWFVMSQTSGETVEPDPVPDWHRGRALEALAVSEAPFDLTDGNVQGFARGHTIAINPVAQLPAKTTFHELGHVLLGHTVSSVVNDAEALPQSLREAEAEAVALICLEVLELPGAEFCRGYIQNWLQGAEIPESSARRIFKAADSIIKAGQDTTKQ